MNTRKLGIIGTGKMGSALVRGILRAGLIDAESILGSDLDLKTRNDFHEATGVRVTSDNAETVAFADTIVLAVKPNVIAAVLDEIRGLIHREKLVVSIAAGVTLRSIELRLPPGSRIIRVMPNTALVASAAASAYALGAHASAEDAATVEAILGSGGIAVQVEEALLDAVTGLSGSGPAYVFLFIDALADGGVKMGLARPLALKLAAQTVYGAAKMLIETNLHPGILKDQVTSAGGTTIAGIHAMETGGVRGALMDAVVQATLRSIELGKQAQ